MFDKHTRSSRITMKILKFESFSSINDKILPEVHNFNPTQNYKYGDTLKLVIEINHHSSQKCKCSASQSTKKANLCKCVHHNNLYYGPYMGIKYLNNATSI